MKSPRTHLYIRFFTIVLVSAGLLLIKLGMDDYSVPEAIKNLKDHYGEIYHIRNDIIHDDEELTMSARMSAVTREVKWENIFNRYEGKLALDIRRAIMISPQIYRKELNRTNLHTVKLLDMEHKAFALIRKGQDQAARNILFGKEYGVQKDAYTGAIERLNALLQEQMEAALAVAKSKQILGQILFFTVFCLLLLSWLIIVRMTRKTKEDLMETNKQLSERTHQLDELNGSLKVKVEELDETNKKLETLYNVQKEFSSTLSHELRTPLATIKAAIDIVLSGIAGEIAEQQKDFLGRAKSNVDRLNRLINDMLDLAHLESGEITLKKEPCAINTIIQSVLDSQEVVARAKGLYLKASFQNPIPVLSVDEDKIIQVMFNLINNAIKFTDSGGITVFTQYDKEGSQVEVRVQDTGFGIEKDDLIKLFEKFQQLGEAHQRQAGTGLGLAICKEIIRQHGGKVGVQSTMAQGSCFYFILPVDKERLYARAEKSTDH